MVFLSKFKFDLKHVKGKENKIEYALTKHGHNLVEVNVSGISTDILEKIRNCLLVDPTYLEIQKKIKQTDVLAYIKNDEKFLMYKNKLYIPAVEEIKQLIFQEYHKILMLDI